MDVVTIQQISRRYIALHVVLLVLLSTWGCETARLETQVSKPSAKPLADHGPAVEGLYLKLEFVEVEPGGHFEEQAGLWADGEPVHWPRLLHVSFINQSRTPKTIYAGLNVDGYLSFDELLILSEDLDSGEQQRRQRSIGSIWGDLEPSYITLPPGATFSFLLRDGRHLINSEVEPYPNPTYAPEADDDLRDVKLWVEYYGGVVVHEGRNQYNRLDGVMRSNPVFFHGRGLLPGIIPAFEWKQTHQQRLDDIWKDYR